VGSDEMQVRSLGALPLFLLSVFASLLSSSFSPSPFSFFPRVLSVAFILVKGWRVSANEPL
jgi:hypothetical protein